MPSRVLKPNIWSPHLEYRTLTFGGTKYSRRFFVTSTSGHREWAATRTMQMTKGLRGFRPNGAGSIKKEGKCDHRLNKLSRRTRPHCRPSLHHNLDLCLTVKNGERHSTNHAPRGFRPINPPPLCRIRLSSRSSSSQQCLFQVGHQRRGFNPFRTG